MLAGALLASLVAASSAAANLTAGDVVVFRAGPGSEALTSNATSAFLDEFDPINGGSPLVTIPFPTKASGNNKAFVIAGSGSSEGLTTLSGNGECDVAVGYNAAVGATNVGETSSNSKTGAVTRTVGVVNGEGKVNTETSLSDFANENNARSATSSDCKKLWVGGAGKGETGGVHFVEKLGASTSTSLNSTDTNVRQVEVAKGQLYTSADATKAGALTIATVGTGLPSTKGQTVENLAFETPKPQQPYAYSLLTLGLGPAPDTLYVADKELGGVSKYGLEGGKWVRKGTVEIPFVTGVTANDVGGLVTIYATSAGEKSREGTLYKIDDVSGVNGTLSGIPVEIAKAPANEAFRGVAFAPGTLIGSGGTPPPAPSIHAAFNALPAAQGDPTNITLPITVEDSAYPASELTVTATSSNPAVAAVSGIKVTGSGSERTVSVEPGTVGTSKLTLTVEAPNHVFSSTQVTYGVSENLGNASDRYYEGASGSATAVDVGGGYMIVGDDSTNLLHLYHERVSGEPVKTWDFSSELPIHAEFNLHSSARVGNTLFEMGSLANLDNGEAAPGHDIVFAATISGSGAGTELTYLGSYTHLREDLVEWDNVMGKPLGFAESTEIGKPDERPNGFKVEGLDFADGSNSEAWVAFRAPLETPATRNLALLVPVTNYSAIAGNGNPGTTAATFGAPLEWNLGGLSIRQIRKNADGEFLVLAATAEPSTTPSQLWGWNGEPEEPPVLLETPVIEKAAEGVWGGVVSVPDPVANGDEVELLEDNFNTAWYGPGKTGKKENLNVALQKSLGRLYPLHIPPPTTPGAPFESSGKNPNNGPFSLNWKPGPTLRRTYTLQHQNAHPGWSTVATGFNQHPYVFTSAHPEEEGSWTYRVKEINESGESAYSGESAPIKVDRSPPNTPTAAADREPDFAGGGGWYKDNVTVSFTAHGDPTLADGSAPSGVDPSTLTSPQTFNTSGAHVASGTVADFAENVSNPVTLTVQVDATPPTIEIQCPETAIVAEAGVHATVTASDAESGLKTDPSGTVPIDTSQAGPFTVTRTAVDNVGHGTTTSCTTQVHYPTPGAPKLIAGASPNDNGLFTLGWTGADPLRYVGLSYTLQHDDAASAEWSPVGTGIEALSYEFSGAGEQEGTWRYRVQGSDPGRGQTTDYSSPSDPVVVDRTPPNAPSAKASRPPDYRGGGGWYRDSVTVSFAANGDPPLVDGSPGSGVEPLSLTGPVTFETSGSHTASGTVADNAGNLSPDGTLVVQVDATPPRLEISCPATALVGESVSATVTAADAESGLAVDPTGTVRIGTTHAGPVTVSRTAVDNVEHETTRSCTTEVKYPNPGAPAVTGGANPNNKGQFTLGWTGADPLQYFGLTYTLQHHDAASSTWTTAASAIEALSYAFTGAGEGEGTWVYRVQGTDSTHGETTEYSTPSAPVVVDETPPGAPTARPSRSPDFSGNGGWYKDSITVSFIANGDPPLRDGSAGSGVEPLSLTSPQTFSTTGSHTASGTVADQAGNVSAAGSTTVKVDATPPSLEIKCPPTAVIGEAGVTATVKAADAESGLASDPSGSVPLEATSPGPLTTTRTAIDNVGHETTRSCTTEFHYPTPGSPTITSGASPNDNGLFTLSWTGANPMGSVGLSYSLQQRNASQVAFREVASNIEALSYTFSGAGEVEGTWVYRVRGTDPTHGETTDFSPVSAPVVVDRTPPFAPTAAPSRAPDFAGGGGWYKDGVSVSFTSRGDPNLADGSAGSGVNTASLSETETFSTSGSHTASGTVADYAGNVSAAGTLVVQVDATPPTLEIECPAQVNVSEGASATVRASDAQSGLASDPSGTVPIDTLNPGSQTTTRTATDNVGHSTTRSCTTKVVGKPPEFGRCVKAPFEEVGGKKIYKGEFTASSCLVTSSSHTGPYEWKPGVVKKGFHIAITSGTRAMFENAKGVKVFCTGESASFTITGAKTVGNVVIKFTGCEGSFRVCNTPGLGAGEIDTKTLEGVLGIERTTIKEGKETRYAGIDLFPVGRKGPFLEYECEALGKTTLSGSVIGSVLTDKMFTSGTDKHIEKSSIQKPEKFLEGEKDVLSNGLEQVGFSDSVVQTNEEAFEINAYV